MKHLLLIGGSRHGEFQIVDDLEPMIILPKKPDVRVYPLSDPRHFDDYMIDFERYEAQRVAYEGSTGLQFRARVGILTPRRSFEISQYVVAWVIEMLLWKDGLIKTKPERYPI